MEGVKLVYEIHNLLPGQVDCIVSQLKDTESLMNTKLTVENTLLKKDTNSVHVKGTVDIDVVSDLLRFLSKIKLNPDDFREEYKWYGIDSPYIIEYRIRVNYDGVIR